MKYKTTRKAIVNSGGNIRSCGYCDMAYLLRNHDATAYAAGVYGWNFDVFEVYGLTICTGYRGMPGERLDGVEEYEEKARKIVDDYETYKDNYEAKREAVENLLKEFCIMNGGY